MSEQKEDSFEEILEEARKLLDMYIKDKIDTDKAKPMFSINSDISDMLRHLAYKIPSFEPGEILEVLPGSPYNLPPRVVFTRYSLPSDTETAAASGKISMAEEEDIIVCIGLVGKSGLYASISSRYTRRLENA